MRIDYFYHVLDSVNPQFQGGTEGGRESEQDGSDSRRVCQSPH